MTKAKRYRLKGRDLAVWSATYAAAFEREFQARRESYGFDHAAEETSAEAALHIADLAVEEMRRWESENV